MTDSISTHDRAQEAAGVIRTACASLPATAVILGSGLGLFADRLENATVVPYGRIPYFPQPGVQGHQGSLLIGSAGGQPVAVLRGRCHYYEGHELDAVTFPVRVLQALGVRQLILTAAVGGITPGLTAGKLMCVSDHLNLIGVNPLRGPGDDRLGTRFPDMSEVYSRTLRGVAFEEAHRLGLTLATGVYAAMPGPCYETPAEVRMLERLGADVVGMSTVPEAIVARHAGMSVLAIAVVANAAAGLSSNPLSHDEVVEAGERAAPPLADLLAAVVGRIGGSP